MSTKTLQTATHAPLRVLIVDDSRAIQAIIQRALQTAGLGPLLIELAMDGEQALRLVGAFEPDLVISDWHMPKVGGLEMLQTLRQIGRHEIKVGFVTTETATRHLDQARSNGALFVINKPFKDEDLQRDDQFMHLAAGLLLKSKDSPEVALKVANLRSKPLEKMGTLMARGYGCSDYRLSVPGYGEGRLTFVLI